MTDQKLSWNIWQMWVAAAIVFVVATASELIYGTRQVVGTLVL